jgi:hypothetical protein
MGFATLAPSYPTADGIEIDRTAPQIERRNDRAARSL